MRNTPLLIVCLILAFSILSCEQRPEGILSKGEMEDVLYDYHLAQAMADWVPGHEGESNQPYLDAVFRKHGITQAEFDSSLVWYNAHASDLKDIYESLKDRFTFESQKLQIEAGDKEMATLIVEGGDTTNLWNGPRLIVLRNNPLLNLEKFSVSSDTLFQPGDDFKLSADVLMMAEERYGRNAQLVAAISILTADGKTYGDSRSIESTGNFTINIDVPAHQTPRQINCYFQYQSNDATRNFGIIRNLSLIRIHTHPAEADTLEVDSAETVVQPEPAAAKRPSHGPRLSPEQLRKQTQDNVQKIEIRTAPEHRTPNSFGPTRRKNNKK
ncbi:MAG: DUF4296 domain-containing protein [Bacteroidaceae bacterium]|nr:DUF4296 domain-containing protein [Bacteroidaceae bacterium]